VVSTKRQDSDGAACPHLGLAADRRSRFTYTHPGHRCFAKARPAVVDPARQATYCLSSAHAACDRYPTRLPPALGGGGPPARANSPDVTDNEFRVHVCGAGEALAGIAADLGLDADQLARANGLNSTDVIAEGARLVIPRAPPSRAASQTSAQRRADRSG
jgi:hypothetical protein